MSNTDPTTDLATRLTTDEPRKAKNLRPLLRLVPYMMRYKGHVALALFFLVMAAITTLSLPYAVQSMIDNGFVHANANFIDSYFLALFAIAALLAVSSAARYYFVIWLGERVVADLRADVFAHITKLSASFFDTAKTGELVSRLTADTTQIKSVAGATASMALRNIVLIIGAVVSMILTSPGLSLIVIVAIPVIVLPIIWFGRNVRKKARTAQDELANATAYASEAITSARTLQAFTAEQAASRFFARAVENAFDAARSSILARAMLTCFAIFAVTASIVAVLWIGADMVLDETITPGLLGRFVIFAVLAAGALGALSEVWGEISAASGAAERLSELLNTEPDIAAPANPKTFPAVSPGTVELDNASFAYPGRPDTAILRGIDMRVNKGETVALVGASGSGKSTILNLILRYYDPTGGTVRVDGIDIVQADPSDLRARLSLVPQDTVIFAMSARDNIRFGRPDASDAEVEQAAKLSLAHDFITDMQHGYDTVIGERGVTLSGGQRQRIAIARAILKDAPILLLDEATSALDAQSETVVQQALDKLMEGRTTIVIAHRLATVLQADRILVMDGGKIVEEGTHSELVARDGLYAQLARLQFDAHVEAAE